MRRRADTRAARSPFDIRTFFFGGLFFFVEFLSSRLKQGKLQLRNVGFFEAFPPTFFLLPKQIDR